MCKQKQRRPFREENEVHSIGKSKSHETCLCFALLMRPWVTTVFCFQKLVQEPRRWVRKPPFRRRNTLPDREQARVHVVFPFLIFFFSFFSLRDAFEMQSGKPLEKLSLVLYVWVYGVSFSNDTYIILNMKMCGTKVQHVFIIIQRRWEENRMSWTAPSENIMQDMRLYRSMLQYKYRMTKLKQCNRMLRIYIHVDAKWDRKKYEGNVSLSYQHIVSKFSDPV